MSSPCKTSYCIFEQKNVVPGKKSFRNLHGNTQFSEKKKKLRNVVLFVQ